MFFANGGEVGGMTKNPSDMSRFFIWNRLIREAFRDISNSRISPTFWDVL